MEADTFILAELKILMLAGRREQVNLVVLIYTVPLSVKNKGSIIYFATFDITDGTGYDISI